MNAKSLIPLVIGLGVGGYALKMVFDTVKRAQGAKPETVNVWTAREDIPRGTSIDETSIQAVEFPANAVPEGAFQVKEDLLGRVPRITAPANLPILEPMLLPPGSNAGLWVRPGFRAVSIKIDESSGVSNLLQPGSRVDMIGYFKTTRGGRRETISRTLIENVEVAAVGARINIAVEVDGKKRGVKPARAVTLFVRPESVTKIHLAEQMGKIKLSMRNSDDGAVRDVDDRSTENDVLGLPAQAVQVADNGSLLDKFKAMFAKQKGEMDAKLKALAQKPGPLSQPSTFTVEPVHTMVIVNGSKRSVLGWSSMDSTEPFLVESPKNGPPASDTTFAPEPARMPADALNSSAAEASDKPLPDWGNDDHN